MTSGSVPSPGTPSPAAPSPDAARDQHTYTVRRAPRLAAVLTVAALAGLLAALAITAAVHTQPVLDPYSGAPLTFGNTFGYTALACLLGAGLLGLLVWLVLDRRSRAAARTVRLERTDDPAEADVSLHRAEVDAVLGRPGTTPSGRTPEQ